MRQRAACLFLLACGLLVGLVGCGSGSSSSSGQVRQGPMRFTLPLLPDASGETDVLGISNLSFSAAPVYITAFTPAGALNGPANQPFVVPARGELRMSLASVLDVAGKGWLRVETRDVNNPDAATGEPTPTATSGYVFPYLERSTTSGDIEADTVPGIAQHSGGVSLTITPQTNMIQLVNDSITENPGGNEIPLGVTYAVSTFGADGAPSGTTVNVIVPPRGTYEFAPSVTLGHVHVEPRAPVPPSPPNHVRCSLAAREGTVATHVEARFLEMEGSQASSLLSTGFDVEYGMGAGGNVHDFALVMSNDSGSDQSVVLQAIYRRGGQPVLTTPRAYLLRNQHTVWMATSTSQSQGLGTNEPSLFQDLFGDVFQFQGFEAVTLYVQAPRSVDVSARQFDAAFSSFHRILRPTPRTNRAGTYDLPVAPSTLSGTRSYVSITNPTSADLTVPIRAFTPMMGTEYILPSVIVPAYSRLDWSPDGLMLREEPTDTVGPTVDFLRIQMTPLSGALFGARVERREPSQAIVYIRPALVRDN
jgi:hypothetical protein